MHPVCLLNIVFMLTSNILDAHKLILHVAYQKKNHFNYYRPPKCGPLLLATGGADYFVVLESAHGELRRIFFFTRWNTFYFAFILFLKVMKELS